MQQLEDDMDELFRDAATQYPLKTEGQDWNAVMSRLHQPGKAPAPVIGAVKGKWYRRFWLLLLTPLFFIAHLPKLNMGTGSPHTLVNVTAAVSTPVLTKEKETVRLEERPLAIVEKEAVAVTASKLPVPGKQSITEGGNRFPAPDKVALPRAMPEESSRNHVPGAEDSSTAGSTGNATSLEPVTAVPVTADSATIAMVTPLKAAAAPDSSKPAEKEKKKAVTKKGFYAGIIVSPDLSTVKLQQTGKVGYGAGVVFGYRISKRLAVETGLLWDRKYYYSKGEYFNTKKIPGATNWNIINVDGWCRMFEIPVQAHYFFNIREKSSWYLNGGLSSYLMNREDYDYSYKWNGNVVTVNRSYDNATRNWFSIIHAGVGYERSIGVLGNLRVEPYLKIPVGGIGLGSLPVTSFGLNMGITKSFR
jgi:hypothetical protein